MTRIPQTKIDEIISAADIGTYISRYVSLKKAGKNLKGLCPFHKEKTPSFMVSPEKQIYHCFGCGKGGNVVGFLMDIDKISFIEAVRKIAFDLGIKLPESSRVEDEQKQSRYAKLYAVNKEAAEFFYRELHKKENLKALNYIRERKFKLNTIKRFHIGFAPRKWDALVKLAQASPEGTEIYEELGLIQKKEQGDGYFDKFRNRILLPFYNNSGRIVGFGGRRLDENDNPKYLNSPESIIYKKGEILYGLYQAHDTIREKNSAILVEGYFDLLRLVDQGIDNVVASSGTAISQEQGRLLKRYTNSVLIAYDSDDAGITAALRNSQILEGLDLNVSIIHIPAPDDPDSYILKNGVKAFYNLIKNRLSPIEFRLRQFLAGNQNISIEDKNQFVDEVFLDLIHNPNDVKVGLYLHQIAERLQIQESFLIARFQQLKKQKRYPITDADRKTEDHQTQGKKYEFRQGQWQAEEGIIALLLLNEKDISNYILHRLSSSDFVNDTCRAIYEYIATEIEEIGHIDTKILGQKFNSEGEQQLITKVLLDDINNPLKFAVDCTYKMRKWSLDSRFNEIKRMINDEASSPDSVLHFVKELTEIRAKLNEIEQERAKYVKNNL